MLDKDHEEQLRAQSLLLEEAQEAREVIERQAYLRFVKYGILPEGNYAWYPKNDSRQDVGGSFIRR